MILRLPLPLSEMASFLTLLGRVLVFVGMLASTQALAQEADFAAYIEFPQDADFSPKQVLADPLVKAGAETSPETQRANLGAWMDYYKGKGATVVVVEPYTLDGKVYYLSNVLLPMGLMPENKYPNLLGVAMEEAAKRGLKVSVTIKNLMHIREGTSEFGDALDAGAVTPELLAALVGELARLGKEAGAELQLNEEFYTLPFILAIDQASEGSGVLYSHSFDQPEGLGDLWTSEDYAVYPHSLEKDRVMMVNTAKWGTSLSTLGRLNLMFGHAATVGKPTGCLTSGGWGLAPGVQQNVCLMRAIQYRPVYYGVIPASYATEAASSSKVLRSAHQFDFNALKALVEEFGRRPGDRAKPVGNLIIAMPDGPEAEAFRQGVDGIIHVATSAILAAGYDLKVTYGDIIPGADLYYVMAPGAPLGDIEARYVDLADNSNRVAFHPIGAATSDLWANVLKRSGGSVAGKVIGAKGISPLPAVVSHRFPAARADVLYRGFDPRPGEGGKVGPARDPLPLAVIKAARPLLAGDLDGRGETALVLRMGRTVFVNGTALHLDMASVIANLIGSKQVFNTNSYGYLTTGPNRSVFLAADDTDLDVNLPGGRTVTVFDEKGQRLEKHDVSLWGTRLKGHVPRWHLVVVN